jgi:hypothetical protein
VFTRAATVWRRRQRHQSDQAVRSARASPPRCLLPKSRAISAVKTSLQSQPHQTPKNAAVRPARPKEIAQLRSVCFRRRPLRIPLGSRSIRNRAGSAGPVVWAKSASPLIFQICRAPSGVRAGSNVRPCGNMARKTEITLVGERPAQGRDVRPDVRFELGPRARRARPQSKSSVPNWRIGHGSIRGGPDGGGGQAAFGENIELRDHGGGDWPGGGGRRAARGRRTQRTRPSRIWRGSACKKGHFFTAVAEALAWQRPAGDELGAGRAGGATSSRSGAVDAGSLEPAVPRSRGSLRIAAAGRLEIRKNRAAGASPPTWGQQFESARGYGMIWAGYVARFGAHSLASSA